MRATPAASATAPIVIVPSNGDDIQDLDEQELVLIQQLEQTRKALDLATRKSGGDNPAHAFLKFEENPTPASYFKAVESGALLSASSPSPSLPDSSTTPTPMRVSKPASASSAMSPSRGSEIDITEVAHGLELPSFDLRERATHPATATSSSCTATASASASSKQQSPSHTAARRVYHSSPLAELEVVNLAVDKMTEDDAARGTELPALDFGSPASSSSVAHIAAAAAGGVAFPALSLCASSSPARGVNASMAPSQQQQFSTSFASADTVSASAARQQNQHQPQRPQQHQPQRPQSLNAAHIDLLTSSSSSGSTTMSARVLTPKKEQAHSMFAAARAQHIHQNQTSSNMQQYEAREVASQRPPSSFFELSASTASFDNTTSSCAIGGRRQYHISHEDAERLAALALEPTSSSPHMMAASTAADISSFTMQNFSAASSTATATHMPLTAQSLSALNEQVLLEAQRRQREQNAAAATARAMFAAASQSAASGDATAACHMSTSRTRSPSPPTSAPNLSRSPSRGSLASSLSSTRTAHSPLMSHHSSPMSSRNSPLSAATSAAVGAASQPQHSQARAYTLASMAPLSLDSSVGSGIPSINSTDAAGAKVIVSGLGDTPMNAQFSALFAQQQQAVALAQAQAQAHGVRHFTFPCPNNVTLTSANVAVPITQPQSGCSPLATPQAAAVKLEDFAHNTAAASTSPSSSCSTASRGSAAAADASVESIFHKLQQLQQLQQLQHLSDAATLDFTNDFVKLEQQLMQQRSPLSHSQQHSQHQHSHNHQCQEAHSSSAATAAETTVCASASSSSASSAADDAASDMCNVGGVLRELCSTCCVQCRKHFKTVSNRNKHLATAQVHSASKSYRCNVCQNFYQTKQSLKTHMKRHERKTYACECNAQFFTKGELRRHKLSHSKVKKYACEVCGKRYPLKQHVTRHMRKIHAELAPVKRQRAKPNTLTLAGADSKASDAEAFLNDTLHMDDAEAGDSTASSPVMSPKHAPLSL